MREFRKLMIHGSGSGVGKSLVTGGICRILYKDGYRVAPFKSQNMALNSFVDDEGKEMGRAQVVQAEMAGIKPKTYMQPILLKPMEDNLSQLVVEGKAVGNYRAKEYYSEVSELKKLIMRNFKEVEENYEICILEGAGSCAEINLRENDIVNMGMAEMIDSDVILVTDIDKGGVFAQIYGTIMLLDENDRKRIKGVIINKFRGDVKLLEPGIKMIEEKLLEVGHEVKVLGVLPYTRLKIEEEDAISERYSEKKSEKDIKISVIAYPYMSNHTDFDVFDFYEDVALNYVRKPEELGDEDIIILPGSKHTTSDLKFLKEKSFVEKLRQREKEGVVIFGICGGLQILGKEISDRDSVESFVEAEKALGLLDIKTEMEPLKKTKQVKYLLKEVENSYLKGISGEIVGYEIHQGVTKGEEETFVESETLVGAYRKNIIGTYIHAIFDNSNFTRVFLNNIRKKKGLEKISQKLNYLEEKEKEFDKWERILRENLDVEKIYEILKWG